MRKYGKQFWVKANEPSGPVVTLFEETAQKLGLSPAEYHTSDALRHWASEHKNERYIPCYLLRAWGFRVDVPD